MALKLRKDVKKSSYYVWFMGAKESKGLRGSEYIIPVIKHLEEREKEVEPFKVTLQVSHKGLKIIQNIVSQGPKNSKPKNETIKHFIPHNTITCALQHEDVVACILLLFNPVTKCPLHVHAYRCDSVDTASLLKQQLQTLIDRPENQKKFAEIEARLKPQKELKKLESSIGSDTGTSTRESESSEERFALENSRVSTLYDSVAAELRAKLGKKSSPILLPPRDYDTVHRQRGNLAGIELRRCLNSNIVGRNVKGRIESSGGSSGIGSDHPPSPDSPDGNEGVLVDGGEERSTSEDEDWNGDPAETSLYLMQPPHHVTLPRPIRGHENVEKSREVREKSPESAQRFSRYSYDDIKKFGEEIDHRKSLSNIAKYLEKPIAKFSNNKYLDRQKSLDREREDNAQQQRERSREFSSRTKTLEKSLSNSNSHQDRYYERSFKEDRYQQEKDKDKPVKYFEDDGFDENIRYREKRVEKSQKNYYNDETFEEKRSHPVPKTRSIYVQEKEDSRYYAKDNRTKFLSEDPRFYSNEHDRSPQKLSRCSDKDFEREFDRRSREETYGRDRECVSDSTTINRRNPAFRQRSPSPEDVKAPKDRFKDAKEKFLLMERERIEQERRKPEPPISPTIHREKPIFIKNNANSSFLSKSQNNRASYDDRYYDDRREIRPKPAPRNAHEEIHYRESREIRERNLKDVERDIPLDRYRHTDKLDPKRRSMFSLLEEEHRKNSNEIARELKRRSYMETTHHSFDEDIDYRNVDRDLRERHFQDLPESDRYHAHAPVMENYSKSSTDLDKVAEMKYETKYTKNPQKNVRNSAGYRHSYAEPKMRAEKNGKKHFFELLHRTNSSVSNTSGRVGIASVHPY